MVWKMLVTKENLPVDNDPNAMKNEIEDVIP